MNRHESLREALGAYTLGALEPDEHEAVQRHLRNCEECGNELNGLAGLPRLLDRLTPDEAEVVQGTRPRVNVEPVLAVVARERSRLRRSVWTWRVAAGVAAAALMVVAAVPGRDGDPSMVFEPRPIVAEASATQGEVQVTAEPWGMRITIDVRHLPERGGYGLWAVRDDGHKALAASWSAPPHDAVPWTARATSRWTSSCASSCARLTRRRWATRWAGCSARRRSWPWPI